MKIFIYGINYAPELTGIGKYTGEMAEWLAAHGHETEVFTAMPYYPEWKIHPEYKARGWHTEIINKVKVHRVPLYVPKNITSLRRVLHELSFCCSLFPVWLISLFRKKADILLVVQPPFHLGFLPLAYARIKGAKVANHVQDLQVDAAQGLGMLKNRKLLYLMRQAEKFIFGKSDKVFTISFGMERKIVAKGIDPDKVVIFPNWTDSGKIKPLSREQSLRQAFGLSEKDKIILYSGNLGEKQGLEIIIDVAHAVRNDRSMKFVIVGSGGIRERLQHLASLSRLENILFFPLQPPEKLSSLLATGDVHLVLQKSSASDLVMPSKLTNIFSVGGCAIITAVAGSYLYELVTTYKMGIVAVPESASSLLSAIKLALTTDTTGYKSNARSYARKFLDKDSILKRLEEELLSLALSVSRE